MTETTMSTTTPPILRALRLLGISEAMVPAIVDADPEQVGNWYSGVERMPVATAMFLVLFTAAWLSKVYKIVKARSNVMQHIERNIIAAQELMRAQSRINQHSATAADYIDANERWATFEGHGDGGWDEFFDRAMTATPKTGERVNIMIAPGEVRS